METCNKGTNLCCTGPLAYGHYSKTYPEIIFHHKRVIYTPGFGDIITRDSLKLIYKFVNFADNETFNNFQGPKKIFPVISHIDNGFQELYLPSQDISIDDHGHFGKAFCLLNSTSVPRR
jgi:hypothetical protein